MAPLNMIDPDEDRVSSAELAFAGLGIQPTRLEILHLVLSHREISVGAIMHEMGLTRNGVRRHLEDLRNAGLVTERRATHPRGSGPITYWRAEDDIVRQALHVLQMRLLDR